MMMKKKMLNVEYKNVYLNHSLRLIELQQHHWAMVLNEKDSKRSYINQIYIHLQMDLVQFLVH